MKLVGIQSSASSAKKWFRAKKSNVIALIFDQIDPRIGEAIRKQLVDQKAQAQPSHSLPTAT